MKRNSARILEILGNENVGPFTLIKFEWNQDHFFTDLPYDVTWNGNTYKSESPLIAIQQPVYNSVIDRESYTLQLDGLDLGMISEVEAGIVHRPVEIYIGFLVDGVASLGLDDPILSYKGTVSGPKLEIDGGSKILSVECSSPLSDLDQKATLYTTKSGMKSLAAGDTSFDQIAEGKDVDLKWGKV